MEREIDSKKICPVCKKVFYVPSVPNWVYAKKKKDNTKVPCCSWSCFRSEERKKEKRNCINCGKEIIGNGKLFCDYYCRADYELLNKCQER